MRRSGALTQATSSQIRAPISLCTPLYMKYNSDRALEGPGRRENQSQVERVVTSSGKVNVASGVGTSPHPPDHHHLDPDPSTNPVIVRGMTAVSFAHGVFTLQAIRATTSASSLPNSPEVAVTAETLKHGGYQLVAHTIPQRKAQAKLQRLSLVTLPISQIHNQSLIRLFRRNCRRRCERQ